MPIGENGMWNNDLIPENINYTKPIIKESAIRTTFDKAKTEEEFNEQQR